MSHSRRWKGKQRALDARDGTEGSGGADGIVLPLDVVGTGVYDVAYTLPVKFGDKGEQFSLQVDTGSSDLWVASTSCSTSSCSQTKGRLYDPSGSTPTDKDFTIPYLEGKAAGPIVWDVVSVGGYTIENQALAAATDVESEPLAPNFSGILGLALPLNSIIASEIEPVTDNDADGAAWASNLFSITPVTDAPASRFLSLALSRPGSDQVPAVLGIGRHPAALVPDPSKVLYSTLVSNKPGILFWKASVRAITVYVDGLPKPVQVGRSASGAVFPTAVLDSGVPLILTTSTVANAIYGAIGVQPSKDGIYYVPCTTPLNLTITIDNRPEIPLHPLDLTSEPPEDNQAEFCIGLIQPADGELSKPDSSIGDMILGVPFLRNVYTVMAYANPNADGTFVDPTGSTSTALADISPKLGLMPLTNPTQALQEFNTVRVLNQPISPSGIPSSGTGSANNTKTVKIGGKLSVGIVVLIGLIAFFALCCALFGARWFLMRRRYQRAKQVDNNDLLDKKAAYMLARRTGSGGGTLTEDELREMRFREYMRKERVASDATVSSGRTEVEPNSAGYGKEGEEFGYKSKALEDEDWDPRTGVVAGWGDDTLVGNGQRDRKLSDAVNDTVPLVADQDRATPPLSPEHAFFPHRRQYSDPEPPTPTGPHRPQQSVDVPLLAAHHQGQRSLDDEEHVAFTSIPSAHISHDTSLRYPPSPPVQPRLPSQERLNTSRPPRNDFADDFGRLNGPISMAGVGSASRLRDSNLPVFNRDSAFSRDSFMSTSSSGTAVGVGVGMGPLTPGGHLRTPTGLSTNFVPGPWPQELNTISTSTQRPPTTS